MGIMQTQRPEINEDDTSSTTHIRPHRLLTKLEVAKLIRKSTRTVEHWVNAGYLSSIRISHSVLFDHDQVIADLKKFETGPRSGRVLD